MNLFWLKYVSFAFLAGAAVFYFLIRLNKLGLNRAVKLSLYVVCIAFACLCWRVQETNAQRNSPRQLIMGSVVSVTANRHKGGNIDDDFRLQLGGGSLSPTFSTDYVASSAAQQPIHQGDVLGVLYRTWDNVPLTIDEVEGQRPGWHYRRSDDGSAFIFGVAFAGAIGLISLLVAMRNPPPEPPAADDLSLHLNDS